MSALALGACERVPDLSQPDMRGRSPYSLAADRGGDNAHLQKLREIGEGCAAVAADKEGILRGFAIPREMLPFNVPAISKDPRTGRGNGRVVRMVLRRESGSPVTLMCWMPQSFASNQISAVVKTSGRNDRWGEIFSNLLHGQPLPRVSERALSPEAAAFEAEMLDGDSLTFGPADVRSKLGAFDTDTGASRQVNNDCDEYAMGGGRTPVTPSDPDAPVRLSGTCSCYEWNASLTFDGDTWHVSVWFSFCWGGGGGDDYAWMIDNSYWQWPCGGATANQQDKLREQYADSNLTVVPGCSAFLYQPYSASFSWSLVQSHSPYSNFAGYDPYFGYAIYWPALSTGLETLHIDTAFTISSPQNRIYSTPHHNNVLRCYHVDTDFSARTPCRLGLNSRHVYGDAADIHTPDSTRWQRLRNIAYNHPLNPMPCAEPASISSYNHLHLDFRAASGALAQWTSCPTSPNNFNLP
jgi:hypothetical protein